MITATKLSKYYGEHTVLRSLTFTIAPEHKVALTGFNGVGKSTLLKIFAGEETFSNGVLEIAPKARIGYVPQEMQIHDDVVVQTFLHNIPEDTVVKKDDAFERSILIYFAGFLLDESVLKKTFAELSSGQKTKVFLTKILLAKPTLLLLDEPTNNLDLSARIWLEQYLQSIDVACVIISHDAEFLSVVTNKIFEIDWFDGSLHVSNAKYSDYLKEKQKQFAQQQKEHALDKEEVLRLKGSAQWKQAKGEAGRKYKGTDNDKISIGHNRNRAARSFSSARVTYNRIKRMVVTEKPNERAPLSFDLDAVDGAEDVAPDIMMNNVVCAQGDFSTAPIALELQHGRRVCIVGNNGVGKSTLLKTISGALAPVSGELARADTVRCAHVMQEHESLPAEQTVIDFLMSSVSYGFLDEPEEGAEQEPIEDFISVDAEEKHRTDILSILDAHSFKKILHNKTIAALSPGERLRLLFVYFSMREVNVLLLDEPTNHIDSEALFALHELLAEFTGTVVAISHDRAFIEAAHFSTIYELTETGLETVADFSTYIEAMKQKAKKLMRMLG